MKTLTQKISLYSFLAILGLSFTFSVSESLAAPANTPLDTSDDGTDSEDYDDDPYNPTEVAKKGDFITRLVRRSPGNPFQRYSRKIYEWPMGGLDSTIGFCGSKHIRGKRQRPHMTAIASCMMAGIAQEWKKKHCPDDAPHCQLTFGDSGYSKCKLKTEIYGYRTRWRKKKKIRVPKRRKRCWVKPPGGVRFSKRWPHASHRKGECIDIWPMAKKGNSTINSRYKNKGYNQKANLEFAKLLVKWGADKRQFFFNDPQVRKKYGAKYLVGHYDHFHVCFRNNKANRKRCRNHTVDTKICPTLR